MNSLRKKRKGETQWFDWAIWAIFAVACFFLFVHEDILVTSERSFLLLQGHIGDFYSASQELAGDWGANYLPSTFFAFAVWNFPLKLLGALPTSWLSSSLWMTYWYKLLPAVFYGLSGWMMYLIACKLGSSKSGARLVAFIFLSAPLAFFSPLIFSQYDILTVFFMLLGFYYYLKEAPTIWDDFRFILFFAVATTFKYFAAPFFVVLLLLRTKKIYKILLSLLGLALPAVMEMGIYLCTDAEHFSKNVFGFNALSYSQESGISLGVFTLELLPFWLCILCAWAFFTNPRSNVERIRYAIFFCCGVSFGLFALMSWHPQWLIIGVPFWTLAACLNKRFDIFILLDLALAALFTLLVSYQWKYWVDQDLLRRGLFRDQLMGKLDHGYRSMADLFGVTEGTAGLLFAAIAAIFLAYFVFIHPRFSQNDPHQPVRCLWPMRLRFILGILIFAIPALLCLPEMMEQPDRVWESGLETSASGWVENITEQSAGQYFTAEADSLGCIQIGTGTYDQTLKNLVLTAEVLDPDTDFSLGKASVSGDAIANNEKTTLNFEEPIQLEIGHRYLLRFTADAQDSNESIALACYQPRDLIELSEKKVRFLDTDYLMKGDRAQRSALVVSLFSSVPVESEEEEEDYDRLTDRQLEKVWEADWAVTKEKEKQEAETGRVSPFS